MKGTKYIKYFSLLLLAGLLMDCGSPTPTTPALSPPKGDDYYEERNRDDKDRGSVLDRAKKRYSGPKCEGDDDCEEYCKDIYNRRSVREDCLELAQAQVEKLWEIYEIFESPKEDDLEGIDPEDFEIFVEIDNRPLDTLINKLSSSETKRVLAWVAQDEGIAEIFQDEDDEYDLLKELLGSGDTEQQSTLKKNIEGGDSFMQIAINDNEIALDWIHSFFSEDCEGNHEEVCILKRWYCEVIEDEDDWDRLIGYEDFEGIVNEVLENYTSNPTTDRTNSSGDLSWWEDDTEADKLATRGSRHELEDLCNYPSDKICEENSDKTVDDTNCYSD